MIVCVCRRVSDRGIDAAILAGARDVDAIARATGAGTDCGCCQPELAASLAARAPARGDPHREAHAEAPCSPTPCAGCPRAAAARSQAA
jgi:bacterioferritin-associated ferredoxin